MNTNLLKSVRVKNGKTQTDMASLIEKSIDTYAKKERGEVYFTPAEMVRVSRTLNLTFSEFNDIFFNSELQFCNLRRALTENSKNKKIKIKETNND